MGEITHPTPPDGQGTCCIGIEPGETWGSDVKRDGWTDLEAFEGSCQCGTVRFRVAAGPAMHSVCHCRMCQRATGNVFAPLVEVDNARVHIEGQIKTYRSSNVAERGFCDRCGTPLFYRTIDSDTTEFMFGAINTGIDFPPTRNHGVESRQGWVLDLASLEDLETYFDEGKTVFSNQWEHG